MQTGTTIDVEKFLNDCISEYIDTESRDGLFNADNKSFWSASLLRRMEKYETLKEKRSQAANARWNKEKNKEKNAKKCKSIKKSYKCNASAYKKIYKCNAKLKNMYAKLCKSNQIKLNQIKLKEIKSIYPSSHKPEKNKTLDEMMDGTEKNNFKKIVSNCEMHILAPELAIEITEIIKEMFMNPDTRQKIQEINSRKLLYATRNFAIANTKSRIQIPKAYFKKCLLSALEQTELSTQFDTDTIYEQGSD